MENKTVLGKNITVQILINDEYVSIFCARSMQFVFETSLIETSSVNSSVDREWTAGYSEGECTLTGIITTQNQNDKVNPFYLFQANIRRELQHYQIIFEAEDGDTRIIQFVGIIRRNTFSGAVEEWATAEIVIKVSGSGDITEETVVTTTGCTINRGDWWSVTQGLTYVSCGSQPSGEYGYLLDADSIILQVDREGEQYSLTTGTPGNRQARWNTSTLRMEFQNPFWNNSATINVLWEQPQ